MAKIQWRPEVNVLTVPPSWKIRFVPRSSAALLDLVRDQYYGRLADVLDVRVGS